eukprot:2767964-Ditylum_brightwellii.AAC.1
MGSWQMLGMFCQASEVQNTGFKSQMGVVEGGVRYCASCDKAVQGWVKLDTDDTMKKRCEPKLRNPMAADENVSGRHIKCKTIN